MSRIDDLYNQMAAAISGIAAELQNVINENANVRDSEDNAVVDRFQPFADRLTALATNPMAETGGSTTTGTGSGDTTGTGGAPSGDLSGGTPSGAGSADAGAGAPADGGGSSATSADPSVGGSASSSDAGAPAGDGSTGSTATP